jgi:hypothetical protein
VAELALDDDERRALTRHRWRGRVVAGAERSDAGHRPALRRVAAGHARRCLTMRVRAMVRSRCKNSMERLRAEDEAGFAKAGLSLPLRTKSSSRLESWVARSGGAHACDGESAPLREMERCWRQPA